MRDFGNRTLASSVFGLHHNGLGVRHQLGAVSVSHDVVEARIAPKDESRQLWVGIFSLRRTSMQSVGRSFRPRMPNSDHQITFPACRFFCTAHSYSEKTRPRP